MVRFIAILMLLLLAGCGFVSYEDVSHEPEYSMYVGKQYKTTEDMDIYRISMERNYGPSPSIYEIVQSPGFGGPEVLSATIFPRVLCCRSWRSSDARTATWTRSQGCTSWFAWRLTGDSTTGKCRRIWGCCHPICRQSSRQIPANDLPHGGMEGCWI